MSRDDPQARFVDALGTALLSAASRIEGAVVVKVQAFNRSLQTVDVVPQVLRGAEQPPPVLGVPVLFPGAYWDLQTDTYGLLVVAGLNWRRWWRTGEVSPAEDTAVHELANGIFIPDLRSQRNPRSIPANATVLEKPAVGGTLHLGAVSADKAAVHEDLLGALDTFLGLLDTWGGTTVHANWAAATAAFNTAVRPALSALRVGIAAGSYQSPSVKVED